MYYYIYLYYYILYLCQLHSLIGFDCGGRHLNITVSLLDVAECNLKHPDTKQYVRLQYNYYNSLTTATPKSSSAR